MKIESVEIVPLIPVTMPVDGEFDYACSCQGEIVALFTSEYKAKIFATHWNNGSTKFHAVKNIKSDSDY